MSTKFHVNPEGNVSRCNAEKGNCPFGEDSHSDSIRGAEQIYAERYMNDPNNDNIYAGMTKHQSSKEEQLKIIDKKLNSNIKSIKDSMANNDRSYYSRDNFSEATKNAYMEAEKKSELNPSKENIENAAFLKAFHYGHVNGTLQPNVISEYDNDMYYELRSYEEQARKSQREHEEDSHKLMIAEDNFRDLNEQIEKTRLPLTKNRLIKRAEKLDKEIDVMLKRNDEMRRKAEKDGDLAYNLKVSIEKNNKLSADSEREFRANEPKINEAFKSLSSDNDYNNGKKRFYEIGNKLFGEKNMTDWPDYGPNFEF